MQIDLDTIHDGMPVTGTETASVVNGDNDQNGFPLDRLSRQYVDVMMMYENDFGPASDFDG